MRPRTPWRLRRGAGPTLALGDHELANALVARGRRPKRYARRRRARQTSADEPKVDRPADTRPQTRIDRRRELHPGLCPTMCVACVSTSHRICSFHTPAPSGPIGLSALYRARCPTSIETMRTARPTHSPLRPDDAASRAGKNACVKVSQGMMRGATAPVSIRSPARTELESRGHSRAQGARALGLTVVFPFGLLLRRSASALVGTCGAPNEPPQGMRGGLRRAAVLRALEVAPVTARGGAALALVLRAEPARAVWVIHRSARPSGPTTAAARSSSPDRS